MKKSTKKYIDERFVLVTDLLQEISERLEKLESKVIHEIRMSAETEYPFWWEYPNECDKRLVAAEGQFDVERPSQPLAPPPENAMQRVRDGHPQDNS